MPITLGSSAWVADETTRARGSAPSSSAAAALARTTALAPSFSGEELPAVIWVVFGWARERGELRRRRVVADRLVVLEGARLGLAGGRDLDRVDLLGKPPGVAGRGSVLMRAQREGIDLLPRQLIAIGDVLSRLHHVDVGVTGEQVRIRRAAGARPHRVEQQHRSARHEGRLALHERPSGTGHRLDPAGQADRQLVASDRVRDLDRAGQRGRAEPVDGRGRHGVGEARRERSPTGRCRPSPRARC